MFAWSTETGKLITKLEPQEGRFNFVHRAAVRQRQSPGHDQRLYHWNSAHKLVGTVPRVVGNVLAATSNSMFLVGSGASLEVYDRDGFDPTDRYFDPKLRIVAHEESLRSIALLIRPGSTPDRRGRQGPHGEGVGTVVRAADRHGHIAGHNPDPARVVR